MTNAEHAARLMRAIEDVEDILNYSIEEAGSMDLAKAMLMARRALYTELDRYNSYLVPESVRELRGETSTEYVIIGTGPAIDIVVGELMREYPPPGYMTRVRDRYGIGGELQRALVWRSNSCD